MAPTQLCDLGVNLPFSRWVKEQDQQQRGGQGGPEWVEEYAVEIVSRRLSKLVPGGRILIAKPGRRKVRHKRADAQNQKIEKALGARSGVLWEELIHEDVNGREEERVANPVVDIDGDR